jgi:signal peptidase II
MGRHAPGRQAMMAISRYLYGPLTWFGVVIAAATAVADQVAKLWLLLAFKGGPPTFSHFLDLATLPWSRADHFHRTVTALIDLDLTWNTGISYGLFPQAGPLGQWALLAIKAIAVVLLWIWLSHSMSRLTALALGLIIGGAIGNAIDRALHGAVVDFVLFHIDTATWSFQWYIFNLADVGIVAGVVGLLYESILAKTPQDGRQNAPQNRPDP